MGARLWARRWVIAALFALGAATAMGVSTRAQTAYRSTAKVVVRPAPGSAANVAGTYAEILRSVALADRASQRMGAGIPGAQLAAKVSTRVLPNTTIIEVSVEDVNPNRAQLFTNELINALAEDLDLSAGVGPVGLEVIQPGDLPTSPVRPKPMRDGLVGGLVGMVLGTVAALLLTRLDNTIRSKDDAASALNLPVLTSVPHLSKALGRTLVADDSSNGAAVEAFRRLRTSLRQTPEGSPIRRVLITSPGAEEGKSTVAANLAASTAISGIDTLLVEMDLRRPVVREYFQLPSQPGLSEVLQGTTHLLTAVQESRFDNLVVLPAGQAPADAASLLDSADLEALLDELSHLAELVIIDSPPALAVADASVLAQHCDAVVIVVRSGHTDATRARETIESLERDGAKVVGSVLNEAAEDEAEGYYTYTRTEPVATPIPQVAPEISDTKVPPLSSDELGRPQWMSEAAPQPKEREEGIFDNPQTAPEIFWPSRTAEPTAPSALTYEEIEAPPPELPLDLRPAWLGVRAKALEPAAQQPPAEPIPRTVPQEESPIAVEPDAVAPPVVAPPVVDPPSRPTPDSIREAVRRAVLQGQTIKPTEGGPIDRLAVESDNVEEAEKDPPPVQHFDEFWHRASPEGDKEHQS